MEPKEPEFVAVSRFVVANGMEDAVCRAFLERPRKVDTEPGFRGFEVLRPTDDAREFWLVTRWSDESCFRKWHGSHAYRESHAGIPKGLKLDPKETRLFALHVVAR
jgi:heme-degrading monooxygenase HmoA